MIVVRPQDSELEKAYVFSETYDRGGFGKNVLGVTHNEYVDFIRIGKLCELVFVRLLEEKQIRCRYDEMLIPCSDEHRKGPDLVLTHSNQEVDVKAANKPFHSRLLVRQDQFKAHVHDIYIGAKYVNDKKVEIHGYVTGDDIRKTSVEDFGYGLCRHVYLNRLQPIERFIDQCLKKQKIR